MGGKSRKSGGVSASLIAQLTKSKPGINKSCCGGTKKPGGEGLGILSGDSSTERD
jgi:hypothetical protein